MLAARHFSNEAIHLQLPDMTMSYNVAEKYQKEASKGVVPNQAKEWDKDFVGGLKR